MLQKVIEQGVTKSFNYNREKLWKHYYLLRTSEKFTKLWKDFLPPIEPSVEPVMYQHLTDVVFIFNTERFCQSRGVDGEIQAE